MRQLKVTVRQQKVRQQKVRQQKVDRRATVGDVASCSHLPCFGCSLDNNLLCGVNEYGDGKYTTEGIVALMQGVQNSNVQSLR